MSEIVCPLCPLHCDDIGIDEDGLLEANGCPIAERVSPATISSPDRGEISIPDNRQSPIRVVTRGVDLRSSRRLSRWQAAGQIDLTIESEPSIEAILQTASRDGMVSATLADVATHADLVWMIGRVDQAWPRLTEKLRLRETGLLATQVQRFEQFTADDLSRFAAAISTWQDRGGSLGDSTIASEMAKEVNAWMSSQYSAILIGPGAFVNGEESLSATTLMRLVRLRNAKVRSVLLTLDAAATLRSVCLWSSNTSPEVTTGHCGDSAFDVRIGSATDSNSAVAKVQIGGVDPGTEQAGAYRAGSIAGLHRPGMVIRGDGSVSLPLGAPVRSKLPEPVDLLAELLGAES